MKTNQKFPRGNEWYDKDKMAEIDTAGIYESNLDLGFSDTSCFEEKLDGEIDAGATDIHVYIIETTTPPMFVFEGNGCGRTRDELEETGRKMFKRSGTRQGKISRSGTGDRTADINLSEIGKSLRLSKTADSEDIHQITYNWGDANRTGSSSVSITGIEVAALRNLWNPYKTDKTRGELAAIYTNTKVMKRIVNNLPAMIETLGNHYRRFLARGLTITVPRGDTQAPLQTNRPTPTHERTIDLITYMNKDNEVRFYFENKKGALVRVEKVKKGTHTRFEQIKLQATKKKPADDMTDFVKQDTLAIQCKLEYTEGRREGGEVSFVRNNRGMVAIPQPAPVSGDYKKKDIQSAMFCDIDITPNEERHDRVILGLQVDKSETNRDKVPKALLDTIHHLMNTFAEDIYKPLKPKKTEVESVAYTESRRTSIASSSEEERESPAQDHGILFACMGDTMLLVDAETREHFACIPTHGKADAYRETLEDMCQTLGASAFKAFFVNYPA
jgi:hypothetical protein